MDIISVHADQITFPPEEKMLRPPPHPDDKDYEEFIQLQKDLEENGIMYPPTVRKDGDKYVVVDGARRVTAIKKSIAEGHPRFQSEVPVSVQDIDDEKALARSIAGNYHSKKTMKSQDIKALKRLAITGQMTMSELSLATGISKGRLEELVKITKLPEKVQELVNSGDITLGNAITLEKLPVDALTDEWIQKALTMKGADFTVAVAEELKELKKLASGAGSSESQTFTPTASYMKKEDASVFYEQCKFKAESDEASDFDRGAYYAMQKVFGLDEETLAAKEAAFNEKQARKKENREARKAEREAKKQREVLEKAASMGFNITGPDGQPIDPKEILEQAKAPEATEDTEAPEAPEADTFEPAPEA